MSSGTEPPSVFHPAALRLKVECNLGAVRQAAESARVFLAQLGFAPPELSDCELGFVEACNNAVQHCRAEASEMPLTVEVLADPVEIEIRVRDHTEGFDWPKNPGLPDSGAERGRGLFLMRSVMDEVAYFRGQGENILVLRKQHRKRAAPQANFTAGA